MSDSDNDSENGYLPLKYPKDGISKAYLVKIHAVSTQDRNEAGPSTSTEDPTNKKDRTDQSSSKTYTDTGKSGRKGYSLRSKKPNAEVSVAGQKTRSLEAAPHPNRSFCQTCSRSF